MADDRTEKPSPRRILKAREQGRFIASRELMASVQFAAAAYLITRYGPGWFHGFRHRWRALAEGAFEWGSRDLSWNEAGLAWRELLWQELFPLWAASVVLAALALAAQTMVSEFGFAGANLAPNFARLNPAGRLKELPGNGLRQAALAVVLLGIFAVMGTALWRGDAGGYLALSRVGLPPALAQLGGRLADLLEKAAMVFLFLGVVDYVRQRRRYMKELSMTKQELRDEHKETDGNPQIKQRIRQLQRQYARRRMMADVEKATAVVVNPTHYAVALKYDLTGGGAPKVVAKGKNYVALRIRERAVRHNVPIVENPPLARTLYASVKVGQEIPAHLYRAVAEVLAYIYRLMGGRLPG